MDFKGFEGILREFEGFKGFTGMSLAFEGLGF